MNLNYQLKITCVEEDKYNWEMTTEDKKEGDHGPDGHVVSDWNGTGLTVSKKIGRWQ